ncbi:MAG TPA: peptidase, partial [Gammaproteobacteria bacterium]|nr:peptidase [Gammaproteobacteria bacterium]
MRGHVLPKVLIAALLTGSLMLSAAVSADTAVERVGWPDVSFDQAVPTLESVLGYAPGERITSVDQAHIYLRALAAAMPERTRMVEYARSWEGRPLVYFLVGTEETMARVDEIKAG